MNFESYFGIFNVSHSSAIKVTPYKNNYSLYFQYPCDSPYICSPYEIHLKKGEYILEVWGAQGGTSTYTSSCTAKGGFGGYSSGIYNAFNSQTIFLYLGATVQKSEEIYQNLYNGGGKRVNLKDAPGGGATDFRTSSGNWNESLESRIIIAGGGGGSYCDDDTNKSGGNGGGLSGSTDSTKTACVGTQQGTFGSSGKCGTLGLGYGGFYGSGGGGKYGGGAGKGLSGGGGGSGSIDKVYSLDFYDAVTRESNHTGPGTARITFMMRPRLCRSMQYCPSLFNYLGSLYIFILCPSSNE